MNNKVICDYCGKEPQMVTGKRMYPHRPDLYSKFFYLCEPCEAYVGCHPGTNKALGRLANKELRGWKSAAHREFDPLWRNGEMRRQEAYAWLSNELGIPGRDTHIGMFDVEMCKRVVNSCKKFKELHR